MEDLQKNIAGLYQKWLDRSATEEEQQQLLQLLESVPAEEALTPAMQQVWEALNQQEIAPVNYAKEQIAAVLKKHAAQEEPITLPRIRIYRSWWAAASVAILLVAGAYWWFGDDRGQMATHHQQPSTKDIPPGREGAILTLADGRQVVLDSVGNRLIADQNGTQVLLQNGQLAYTPTEKAGTQMVYNTMSTPRGRQFTLQLPDGTKVWLNAASSLKYPAQFNGTQRRVEISGEAYFEVAQNARQPFVVQIKDQAEITVLGTRFNVNAYDNENSIQTILLEGSVKVKSGQQAKAGQKLEAILKPGQLATIIPARGLQSSSLKVISDPNIDKVMAWKNGVFNFDGASLAEVMRQLERWYDIEVVYEKGIPDIRFGGEISRNVSLEGVIAGLQAAEVHFRIDGKRLVVMP